MKKITSFLTVLCFSLLSLQMQAQNGGDDCASAVAVDAGMVSDTTINDVTAGTANGDSAWFVYTATDDGTISVNSCSGGADTRLFIWNDCADGAAVANNDDAANCPVNTDGTGSNFASRIEDFPVTSGEDYFIQWDDRWSLGPFNWTLDFVPPPTCPEVANIMIDASAFEADLSWDAVAEASNGYIVSIFTTGADPMADTPVFTENVAAGTLMTTATGLESNTIYDAYVIADCDASGLSVGDPNTFITPVSCSQPSNFESTMATTTDITFTWEGVEEATNGYILSVFNLGADPMVDMPVFTEMIAAGVTTGIATGLTEDTLYDAYITADCGDVNGTSNTIMTTAGTAFEVDESCGGVYLDSGGLSSGYSANEEITTTIMPDEEGEVVTVTFTYVDIETAGGGGVQDGCWDFLTVYDGPDITSPVLAMTLCGEESGDGGVPSVPESNLAIGMSFTSTDPSGALTFVFTSDGSVQETGWEADITCENLSLNDVAFANFSLSPNPTTDILNVTTDRIIDSLEVYNILGQKVLMSETNANNTSINVSQLSPGTYFIQATSDNNITTKQFIKQ